MNMVLYWLNATGLGCVPVIFVDADLLLKWSKELRDVWQNDAMDCVESEWLMEILNGDFIVSLLASLINFAWLIRLQVYNIMQSNP